MAKCDQCGREFSTEAALSQHKKDKHSVDVGPRAARPAEPQQASRGGKSKPRSLRKRNRHPVVIGLAAVAIVLGLGLYVLVAPNFAPLPVPCTGGENYTHIHPYLRISIEGTNVPVPAGLGLNVRGCAVMILHTHDASGIIHVELGQSDNLANFTLGDFIRVWAATHSGVTINGTSHPVEFTNTDIFGYKTDATHKVVVLVDNKTVANGVGVPLEQLDFCDATTGGAPPCAATVGANNPLWKGTTTYPYGTGHTIKIEYVSI